MVCLRTLCVALSVLVIGCKARTDDDATLASTPAPTAAEFGPLIESANSNIPAAVDPQAVPGDVTFAKYSAQTSPSRRIRTCFLVHGYGITAPVFEYIKDYAAKDFASIYFGPSTVETLLDTVCKEVVVLIQESNDTTILEMTLRTESMMRGLGCESSVANDVGVKWPCAIIGHSKGGAVATTIARRCMLQTSTLGERGCKGLGEIYSATGVPFGAGATLLIYGAYQTAPSAARDALIGGFATLAGNMIVAGLNAHAAQGTFAAINMVWKLDAPYEANPTWRDLSPGAPMEGGVPLYLASSVPLEKTGWLVADYAASGTNTQIGVDALTGIGCGTATGSLTSPNRLGCEAFAKGLTLVHLPTLKDAFLEGRRLAVRNSRFFDPRQPNAARADYFNRFTWESYQTGDGLADYHSALGPCWLGGSAVPAGSCTTLRNINHQASAGGAQEALDDFVAKLKE